MQIVPSILPSVHTHFQFVFRTHFKMLIFLLQESVDTPVVERRKNWLQRQITRMGSVRSSSTTYSSGGLFRPTRRNSMYSTAETAIAESGMTTPAGISVSSGHAQKDANAAGATSYSNHKMSFYDRLVGRRSTHGNKLRPGM